MDQVQTNVLITDAERERALTRLREACIDGRLTLDEFSQRAESVLGARTQTEIGPVMADLVDVTPQRSRRAPARRIVAIMGSNKQRGRWRIAEEASAVALMGECQLDLRTAEVPSDQVEITAVAFMGNVKVIVPEGVDVEMTGLAFMGSKESVVADVRLLPGAPLIRVRAYVVMGEVKVESAT